MSTILYGALEAGGTKCLCAVGMDPENLEDITSISTKNPVETLEQITAYFHPRKITRLGIAAFGPLNLVRGTPDYGMVINSPKQEWQGVNFRQYLQQALGISVTIDTDVNAALLAEKNLGSAKNTSRCAYLTIGTGIGGAFWTDGGVYKGQSHSEIGHIRVPRVSGDDFPGCCPFHGDCLEGMASGEAIRRRWNADPQTLPLHHLAWQVEADYLALGLVTLLSILVPERIVMGGGVMQQTQLFPMIRARVSTLLHGYLHPFANAEALDKVIVPPRFQSTAGLVGALQLAMGDSHSFPATPRGK